MRLGQEIAELCMGCMTRERTARKCAQCGFDESEYEPAPHHLPLRTILGGKYFVGRVLGEGGFGITYLGWDLNLDLKLAIKEYYPTGFVTRDCANTTTVTAYTGDSAEFYKNGREKFINEAKTLAKFYALPGIVSVKDFFLENGTAYIVMEFIDGQTLKEYLRQMGGKLPAAQVFDMMKPLMRSLAEVHKAGMIHRDISPDNIMITKEGNVKLLDFGAARDFSDNNKSLSVLLKPGYAPEEQYRTHGKQGPWTDVYALCATMYRAITGKTPPESLERLREDALEKPSALGIVISAEQESALLKGLAVFQHDRWQDILAFSGALRTENVPVPPVILQAEQPSPKETRISKTPASTPTVSTAETTPSFSQRISAIPKRVLGIAGGACAAVLVLALAVNLLQNPVDIPVAGAVGSSEPAASFSAGSSSGSFSESKKQEAVLKAPEKQNEVVVWRDAALEALMREALEKPTGDITASDLANIQELYITGGKILLNDDGYGGNGNVVFLDDLRYCKGLTTLTVEDNKVSDLAPLVSLSNLTSLDVSSNHIKDLSPLAQLESLTNLDVSYNQIFDLSPLANLTALTELSVQSNQISLLSPLAELTNLTDLSIAVNQVSDLSPLAHLTGLTHLWVASNSVSDLTPLSNLTNLSETSFSDAFITDWSPIAHVKIAHGRPVDWEKTAPAANHKAVSGETPPQSVSSAPGEDAEALYLEGSELYPDGNAVEPLLKSAQLGNVDAQYLLGLCYDYGEGGAQEDDVQAFTWMLKAAHGGNETAAYVVGQDYAWGYGTEKNTEQALYWLQKAAKSKDGTVQYGATELLKRHENGEW